MRIAITIDVEEEGLFSGNYPSKGVGVTNVQRLDMLAWLTQEFDLPLTLLVDYPVAVNPQCAETLKRWHTDLGAEIGAHLHPWNTPPLGEKTPLDSSTTPQETIREKLRTLTSAIENGTGVRPTSFRMGRWDFSARVREEITKLGFKVDASVAPLKRTPAGGEYFLSSPEPYWLDKPGGLLEVPLTMLPIFPGTTRLAHALYRQFPNGIGNAAITKFSSLGAVGIQPVWHSSPVMRQAVRLHQRRGGDTLTMFFHSSELLPGASPHFPTEQSVRRFVAKIRSFIEWLSRRSDLKGTTLSALHDSMRQGL
ncbi:hypothetical protein [uncultured Pseudodesulfovibrio sp.]|uniref:hypothetical protein n=1 Tax=uncultured Pseudodesulfovibrio sp. TaxID=2035858 RepID=UPI0029C6F4E0|nr:hypothetical protein [uncultured Pseudodesulfovibrio sp.]